MASYIEFSYFLHMVICYYINGFNSKIIFEPISSGIFKEKVYVRLNENGHNVSMELVYESM